MKPFMEHIYNLSVLVPYLSNVLSFLLLIPPSEVPNPDPNPSPVSLTHHPINESYFVYIQDFRTTLSKLIINLCLFMFSLPVSLSISSPYLGNFHPNRRPPTSLGMNLTNCFNHPGWVLPTRSIPPRICPVQFN